MAPTLGDVLLATLLLMDIVILGLAATGKKVHFVPNSLEFWDDSEHWPTNYGPAYRDTTAAPTNFLPCDTSYALCANSGPEPLPCFFEKGGRFATCKCTIGSGLNYVMINGILNYDVYQETIAACNTSGTNCQKVNSAPVCNYMNSGKLIPGAQLISDFNPGKNSSVLPSGGGTTCPKGPYAGCMTAPCKIKDGYAYCSCPVFYGPFQLKADNAQCVLENGLIWSSAYFV